MVSLLSKTSSLHHVDGKMSNATEVKAKHRDTEGNSERKLDESLDNVKSQLLSYGNQIHKCLENVDAKVDGYKFSVERKEDGLTVDCQFKATILQKELGS